MKYTKIEGIDKNLSRLTYGTPGAAANGSFEEAAICYDMAYEMGFRTFDTAYSYGNGEENLGKWLIKSGHRDDVVIIDKGCNPRATYTTPDIFSADTIRTQIQISLDRLQTDHVEMYILHRDDPAKPVDEIVEVLNELKADGKIIRFGGSNWGMERIKEANKYAANHGLEGFSICSPNFTYMRLVTDPWGGSVSITGENNKGFRDWLSENQMPIFNYSALARGFMSGKYKTTDTRPIEECIGTAPVMEYYAPENIERLRRAETVASQLGATVPQIGIAWLMKQPLNLFPIVGPSSEKHLKEVVEGLNLELTNEQLDFLDASI